MPDVLIRDLDPQLHRDLKASAVQADQTMSEYVIGLLKHDLWTVKDASDYAEIAFIRLHLAGVACDDCGAATAKFAALDGAYRIRNLFCGACVERR